MEKSVIITKEARNGTFDGCTIYGSVENSGRNISFRKAIIGVKNCIKAHPVIITSFILPIVVGVIMLFLEYNFFKGDQPTMPTPTDISHFPTSSEIPIENVKESKLPYLSKQPILDGRLFIYNYFTQLQFGGVNLASVKLNAMTGNGDNVEIKYVQDLDVFVIDIYANPLIEFEYKGIIYELKISHKPDTFYYSIKSIPTSTMMLKSYSELVKNGG